MLAFAVTAPCLCAEVIIYSLSFSNAGQTVNYSAFDSGYAVIDQNAGSFSSVMVLRDPVTNVRYQTSDLLSGRYFDLIEEGSGELFGVMATTSVLTAETLESLSFQVLGEASRTSLGAGISLRVPQKMRGFLLASSPEASSVDDAGRPLLEYGLAGASRVTARFDRNSTRDANNARLSAAATLDAISATLERRGIRPEPTPTPTPTPTPAP
jgi:hypothetical protein